VDTTFDNEKLVAFKGNSANCIVFEYYNELPKAGTEHKSAFLMCPKDNTDAMRAAFTENMDKAWKELNLDIVNEVYMLDDCHTFNMSTTIDGQEASGKMRIDSGKGLLKADGSSMVNANSDGIANCKIFFNDDSFSKDIESTTPKHCCFHYESATKKDNYVCMQKAEGCQRLILSALKKMKLSCEGLPALNKAHVATSA